MGFSDTSIEPIKKYHNICKQEYKRRCSIVLQTSWLKILQQMEIKMS